MEYQYNPIEDQFNLIGLDSISEQRISNLENLQLKIAYYAEITTISGQISKPQNSTILLNQWSNGIDAITTTIEGNKPTFQDTEIDVISFDTDGNYTVSNALPTTPLAFIYYLSISLKDFSNLNIEHIIDYVVAEISFNEISNITKEPTGFADPENIVITYNKIDRTVTISGDITAYWRGKIVNVLNTTWTSLPHSSTPDNYFLYYNGTDFIWSNQIWTFDKLQITTVSINGYALKETHGLMPWQTHQEFHNVIGTYRTDGGDFSNFTLASTTPINRRLDISSTTIKDEDCVTLLDALTSKLYTIRYLTSINTVNFTVSSNDITLLSGNRPYYNRWDGSSWVQTLFSDNNYGVIFIMGIPTTSDADSSKYRYQFIQSQDQYNSLTLAQRVSFSSLILGNHSTLEYTIMGKIIIRYSGSNWRLISVEKLLGTQNNAVSIQGGYLSNVNVSGLALNGNGTSSSPLTILPLDGWMDYNDLASAITPINYVSPNPLKITNDGLGAYTNKLFKPLGITELFNTTTNQFTFSDLVVGDELMIRLDLTVANNTDCSIDIYLLLDIGGFPYNLNFESGKYLKKIGISPIIINGRFYIGSETMRINPSELYFRADCDLTLTLNGFYISVRRRIT